MGLSRLLQEMKYFRKYFNLKIIYLWKNKS